MTDSIVIMVLTFGIMLFGISYGVMSYSENLPIANINQQIDSGLLSQDTVSNFEMCKYIWETTPIFFLIGVILYFYERGKGTDLPASTFFEYEVLMIVCAYISMFLVWGYGLSIDAIFNSFDSNRLISDIAPMWDRSRVIHICIKMAYIGCMIPTFVGCFLYMIHPIIKQTDNTFLDFDDGDEESEEYVTQYQLQQF